MQAKVFLNRKGLFLKILVWSLLSLIAVVVFTVISRPVVPGEKTGSSSNVDPSGKRWFRGNTHTHTKFLDYFHSNRVSVIASWYKDAGYDFLIITDHNTYDRDRKVICHEEVADPPGFIMLCGLELSRTRHHTALGIDRYIGDEVSLQDGVNKIIEAGGVPILNHPMFPVVSASEFIATKGLNHLEVFNGKRPKDTYASEMLWDSILSAPGGRIVYALAADDNHHRKRKAGKGWIMVEAPSLTAENIEDNIRRGNFYSSTGIILKDYRADRNEMLIDTENGTLITFIGYHGKVLSIVSGSKATYKATGNEHYIRIKVTGEDRKMAWTQPVFLK
jgi:predicted metal-dependent phosphoesterase TrpH